MFASKNDPTRQRLSGSGGFVPRWTHTALWLSLACGLLAFEFPGLGFAQFQAGPRQKLPVINKITSNGPARAAFTGEVQSLDRKLKVLNVSGGRNEGTVIFPLKKKVKVSSISGQKLKLAALTPGTNVVVYYEQQDARRTIQKIVILGTSASQTKKHSHPS
jgi:hypothetical protein